MLEIATRPVVLPSCGLDCPAIEELAGLIHWLDVLRNHNPATVAFPGIYLEASSLRFGAGPRAREKKDKFAAEFSSYRHEPYYCLKMRPTCSCFLPFGVFEPSADNHSAWP